MLLFNKNQQMTKNHEKIPKTGFLRDMHMVEGKHMVEGTHLVEGRHKNKVSC